ncbi:transporter substrate-binding domain-containing protein [Pararhizobium haloflavum]|uniref:transporter substrate-binding domain-containing protein n=1 Tax=Pararhizobium haloflavum TaxID=2037914 RepID=UPI001FDFAA43|nr:transporter substrate-binding domain-containing protein [Pararhizobium haloflavum]
MPNHFDPRERMTLPDLSRYPRIRFLTTTDFPPFNFLDQEGRLSGLHVDLVRAICEELDVADRCQLQAMPFDELDAALENGRGEAIIAGVSISDANRQRYRFTRSYLKLPARFIIRADPSLNPAEDALAALPEGARIGVVDGTAHEAMARAFFPDLNVVAYGRPERVFDALKDRRIKAAFGDGMQFSFWLGSQEAERCCRFLDGPFFSDRFLGQGLAIAVASDDRILAEAFDHAILALNNNGRFAEIYLRYFPNGLY